MTEPPAGLCRRVLDEALAGTVTAAAMSALAAVPAEALDDAMRSFADAHGAAALPVLVALGDAAPAGVRRTARRALYRLSQRGITPPARPAPRPVVERGEERPVRAWISAIDGSGSRAMWLLFEGAFGGLALCSLIVNDVAGILEVAGGGITKKRLAAELEALRAEQKLPWLPTEASRVLGLVAEALALHRTLGTAPPSGFARWQRHFDAGVPPPPAVAPADPDPALVARGADLLQAPEMAGWFLEPTDVQAEALELLQGDQSREDALVTRVVERALDDAARSRWARRLLASAEVFEATERAELAAIARAAAGALARGADTAGQPFARALARRALEVAGEVATGRVPAATATRKPA